MRGDASFQWAAGINQPNRYNQKVKHSTISGSEIQKGESPCVDCGRAYYHLPGCSLDDTRTSKWSGSEIPPENCPCSKCGGTYFHADDCIDDYLGQVKDAEIVDDHDPMDNNPNKKQGKWSLTKAPVICKMCFGENGHRATCPTRLENPSTPHICTKCGMEDTPIHTERMCIIRQAAVRIRTKEDNKPCEKCAGTLAHFWPCTNVILVDSKDVKVQ